MKILVIILSLTVLLCSSEPGYANQIRELLAMDFGVFTITDSGAHSIIVAPDGNTTTPDGGINKLRNGRNARFQITQINPATMFYITIDPTSIMHSSGSPVFTIDTFTFDPANDINNMIHADPDASLTINIGATLHIPPGTPVTPGPYRGTYNFLINF